MLTMSQTATNYRNRETGKVVKITERYAALFPDQFELLGDEYEEHKVVVEADPTDARPAGNASREKWAEYASILGHDVPDELGRDDIVKLIDADETGDN